MKNLLVFNGLHRFSLNDLTHLQEGYKEAIASLAKALVNIADPVILDGCTVNQVGQDYNVTAGAIYHNGEIFQVDAHTHNTAGTPNWGIVTTYGADNPVVYQDSSSHNVHEIKKARLQDAAGIAQWNQIRRIEWVLRDKLCTVGEIKLFAVSLSDFDGTGLGQDYKQWENWAIMNGNNGTIDMGGFFPVGMKTGDTEYDNPGDTGGLKEVTLTAAQSGVPAHTHPYVDNGDAGATGIATGGAASFTNLNKVTSANTPQDASQAHENRPPFKALRFIQKIA